MNTDALFHIRDGQNPYMINQHTFNSRSASVVSIAPGTPQMQPNRGPPMMFSINDLHALNFGGNNDQMARWFPPWANMANNRGPIPQSDIMSQITQSQISRISSSNIKRIGGSEIDRSAIDDIIKVLSTEFDIRESEINVQVLQILGALTMRDLKCSDELMDALWKALSNIDHRQLVIEDTKTTNERLETVHTLVLQFYNLNKKLSHSGDSETTAEKQRVLRTLLVLLRYKPDDHLFQLIDGFSASSQECLNILCIRSDPNDRLMDSLVTMQIICRRLKNFQIGTNSPRILLHIIRIILTIVSGRNGNSNSVHRLDPCNYFVREGLELVLNFFDQCIQISTSRDVPPALKRYSDICDRLVRNVSRLIQYLSDTPNYVDILIDLKIMERSLAVENVSPLTKTGIEARQNFVKTCANLSCCKEKLKNINLNNIAVFTLKIIRNAREYSPQQLQSFDIKNIYEVAVYGTGFLSNIMFYNKFLAEYFVRDPPIIQFIMEVALDCSKLLDQCQSLKSQSKKLIVRSLVDTIEHCIKILCFLNNDSNSLAREVTHMLLNSPAILSFTYFALFRPNYFRYLSDHISSTVLKMWDRGLGYNFYPQIPSNPETGELSMFLLEFFATNIKQPEDVLKNMREDLNLTVVILQKLIENQNQYAPLIENRLCCVDSKWMPFQVLNSLNSVESASCMLNFLQLCAKLDRLKQLWSDDVQNKEILNKFVASTDPKIHTSSYILCQLLFPNDYYNIADAFTNFQ